MYTYKDGYREGVVFVFLKGNKILIEKRPVNGSIEIFYPSGSIEKKDYKNKDYKINALLREVNEEFDGKVNIDNYTYLMDIKVDEINVIFHVFLINKWSGEIPSYTIENGKKHSKVEFIDINKRDKYFKFKSAFEICNKVIEYVKENQL